MKLFVVIFLVTTTAMAAPVDLGPLFPILTTNGISSAPNACTAGLSASGIVGLEAFVFQTSTGNLTLLQLTPQNYVPTDEQGFSTASNTRPSVTNSSSTILSSNTNRKYAYIINSSGSNIFLKLGATAVVNQGIAMSPGDKYEITKNNLFLGSVNAIKSGGTVTVEVFEGTP